MSSSLRCLLYSGSTVVLFALIACSAKSGQQCVGDDLPDPMGEDSNCDGIDGIVDQAIFVSPLGMDTNPGTREQPLKTIHAGLAMASTKKKPQVLVAGGDYDDGETLQFPDKLGIYGGHDKANWTKPRAGTNVRVAKPL